MVIGGSLYDLLVPSVPSNHLAYLGAVDAQLDPRYSELDLALLRSIGGCLLAIGVTALVLANGPIRRGEGWARVTVVLLVGVAEGNNAYRMFRFGSPWYGPLGFAVLAAAGAVLAGPPLDRRKQVPRDATAEADITDGTSKDNPSSNQSRTNRFT
jgi:hypothetical protein